MDVTERQISLHLRLLRSAWPVNVPAVLDPQNYDSVHPVIDLVDHSVVASASGIQPGKFSYQRLPGAARRLGNWPQNRFQCSRPDLVRKLIQVTKALRCDLNLIHNRRLHVIAQAHPLTTRGLLARPPERGHQLGIPKDLDRFFHRLQVVRTQQDERGPAVARHHDACMLPLDPIGKLRQMGLGLRKWNGVTHWSEV